MKQPDDKIALGFKSVFWLAIIFISVIMLFAVVDVVFDLGWGYSKKDIEMGVVILTFAVFIRFIGGKIIAYYSSLL